MSLANGDKENMSHVPPWLRQKKPVTLDVIPANIPQELKEVDRWVVWKAEVRENGKINKPPYQGKNPSVQASTNNPSHLCDFDTAVTAYMNTPHIAGIGFVADKNMELVFVDIDGCVVDGEINAEAFTAVTQFMSYAEISPSGNGIRIVAKGGIKFDFNNSLGFEMYGGNGTRYLTFTGHVIEDAIHTIEPAQDAISYYFEKWKTNPVRNREKVKIDNIEDVEEVDLSRVPETLMPAIMDSDYIARTFTSRDKAIYAVAMGLLNAGYDKSEVLSVLSNPEYAISEGAFDRRKTRESAKEWILSYTLSKALEDHAAKLPPVAFSFSKDSRNEPQAVDPEQEKEKTEYSSVNIKTPPGLVGDLAKEILANAIRPQPMFAISGALMAVSIASQNYYQCEYMNGSLNLYMVQVGGTASGKDGPRKAIKRIFSDIGMEHLVPESVASGAALLRSLSRNNCLCYMPDEFGLLLQTALNERGSIHLKDMVSELMRLYSLANSTHTGKRYAKHEDDIEAIRKPYVSLLGTTTPEELASALSVSQVDNGFLNRILYIEAEDDRPSKQWDISCGFSADVKERLKSLTSAFGGIPSSIRAPETIYFTKEATGLLRSFDVSCDEQIDDDFGALWNRAGENAVRVAGVLAVGAGGQPNVTGEMAKWAIEYVSWCVKNMARYLRENMAGSRFESQAKRALKYIKNAKKYSSDKTYSLFCSQGFMPKRKLLKLMKCKSRELDEVIDFLIESDEIEKDVSKSDGKGRPMTIFRVF